MLSAFPGGRLGIFLFSVADPRPSWVAPHKNYGLWILDAGMKRGDRCHHGMSRGSTPRFSSIATDFAVRGDRTSTSISGLAVTASFCEGERPMQMVFDLRQ